MEVLNELSIAKERVTVKILTGQLCIESILGPPNIHNLHTVTFCALLAE